MIRIEIEGHNALEVRQHMRVLLGDAVSAPAVYEASSDKMTATEAAGMSVEEAIAIVEAVQPTPAKRTRKPKAVVEDPKPPVEPTPAPAPEGAFGPTEGTAAQDAADEAAETETTEDAPLTLDDVRNSALPYITKWGKEAAAKDLVPIVQAAGGVPNIGKLDPADQALLRKVMAAFADAAKADKRFGQEA